MEFIDSPAKASVVGAFVKNSGKWLGISRISALSGTSVSAVWRQMPTLLRYGIVVEGRKGSKYRAYRLNEKSRLTRTIVDLYAEYKKAVPVRGAAVKYEELKRSKNKNFGKIIAAMDAFEARRGGRPKSREEILTLTTVSRKAWKRDEASGRIIKKGDGLRINVD
jgi:hypothetical protein